MLAQLELFFLISSFASYSTTRFMLHSKECVRKEWFCWNI